MADTDNYEMTEEQFASIFAALGFFRDLNQEQPYYDELVNLCTPSVTRKMHLTIRNAKVLVLAIHNLHLDWMTEQDKAEWEGYYHRRIQKYKLIKEKLAEYVTDQSEALKYSCQETPLALPQ
jgi:hypothetical protein